MDNFPALMGQTYISAAIGNIVAQLTVRGVNGTPNPVDYTDIVLSALQTGTVFISNPIGYEILRRNSKSFREKLEDENASKLSVWIEGGILGAAVVAAVNYPISTIQKKRRGEKQQFTFKGLAGHFADQLGSSIGFAMTNDTLNRVIPSSKNSLVNWVRGSLQANVSKFGGKCCALPVHYLRHGTTPQEMVSACIKGAAGVIITRDTAAQLRNVLGFMVQ